MAGPIPYQITVNGEAFTMVRTRDDISPSWADEQSANSTLYSISGNTVVWENGGILQLNSVDVLPTDEIVDTAYTTRQGGGTMSKSYDLSTSSKWSALSDGEHTVQIVAKGTGYRDSAKSTSVTVTKGGSTGETWLLNEEPHFSPLVDTIEFEVPFSINSVTYSVLRFESELVPMHTDAVNISVSSASIVQTSIYYSGSWVNEAYRTITFETAPTGDLLTWLQANGTKQ